MGWCQTTHFGCAVARSASGKYYVACNYSPAGNSRRNFRTNVPPLGGFPELEEATASRGSIGSIRSEAFKEDAATAIQALSRGHKVRRGAAELRTAFKLHGELEILDDTSQEWHHAVIVKMGGGKVIAEYRINETSDPIQKQI